MKKQLRAFVLALALVVAPALAGAQSLSYTSGQNVSPAYEGWEKDADGTKYFLFGYMNRNWDEEIDVPVGPDNGFIAWRRRPGAADALPAAPQPVRVPRQGAGQLHGEGRTGLDAHDPRRHREGLRDAPPGLHRRRCGEGVGDRRARRRLEQPRSSREQATGREGGRAEDAHREGRPAAHHRHDGHRRRHSEASRSGPFRRCGVQGRRAWSDEAAPATPPPPEAPLAATSPCCRRPESPSARTSACTCRG